VFVVQVKAARKPYSAPAFEALDPSAAKAKLATVEGSEDGSARKMLSVAKKKLEKRKFVEPSPVLSFSSQ
jgi:hypothetical protein